MIQMDTEELCLALNGKLIAGFSGEFTGVSIDSRKIESGQLFFAIIGENFDGHDFVSKALVNGGAGAIVMGKIDIPLAEGQFLIQVEDTTKALQELAHYYRKQFAIKIIGVTGSSGKTTTKDMIAAVLAQKYNVLKTIGNLNNYYGLPLTMFQLNSDHEIMVVEMGMSALKEIELLAKLAEPEFGVVTNVGHSHIEYLKTLDNVRKAKQELIENLVGERVAILNCDDSNVYTMASAADQVIFYGFNEKADYRAIKLIEDNLGGCRIILQAENSECKIDLPLPGEHNVYNALAAIAVGRIFRLNFTEIQDGFQSFHPSNMRMNIRSIGQEITLLNDAYNANPESMRASIKVLAKASGRKIAVLGDMLELGEYAEKAHRELGKFTALSGIDLIFVKGEFRNLIKEGALDAGFNHAKIFLADTNQSLAEQIMTVIKSDDTILIKGSRGMAMEEIIQFLETRSI